MAVLIIVSTMSFTIDMRYCDGDLLETTIFSNTDSCDDEQDTIVSEICCKPKRDCCSEEQIIIDGLDNLSSNSFDSLKLNSQFLLAIWVRSYLQTFVGTIRNKNPNKDYISPKLIPDIQKLQQVYLL